MTSSPDYLEELRRGGRLESSGTFSLDVTRAFAAFQSHGTTTWLPRFVASAVAGGASYVLARSGRVVRLRYNGRVLTREDLSLFEELALRDPVLRYLGLGMFGAAGQGHGVEVVSLTDGVGVCLRLGASRLELEELRAREAVTGTWVEVVRKRQSPFFPTEDLELQSLHWACSWCHIPVTLDDKLVNVPFDAGSALGVIEFSGLPVVPLKVPPRLVLPARLEGTAGYLLLDRKASWMHVVVHGIVFGENAAVGRAGVLRADGLPLDLTGDRLVQGPEFEAFGARVHEAAADAVTRWLSELEHPGQLGGDLQSHLVESELVSSEAMASALARLHGVPLVDPVPAPEALELVPRDQAWGDLVLPLKFCEDALVVAMADPSDLVALEDVRRRTGRQVAPAVASRTALVAALTEAYGPALPRVARAALQLVARPESRRVAGRLPEFVDWDSSLERWPPPEAPVEPPSRQALLGLARDLQGPIGQTPDRTYPRRLLDGFLGALLPGEPGRRLRRKAQPLWDSFGFQQCTEVLSGIVAHCFVAKTPYVRLDHHEERLLVLHASDPAGPWREAVALPGPVADELASYLVELLAGHTSYHSVTDGIRLAVLVAASGRHLRLRLVDDVGGASSIAAPLGRALLAYTQHMAEPLVVSMHMEQEPVLAAGEFRLQPHAARELAAYLKVRARIEEWPTPCLTGSIAELGVEAELSDNGLTLRPERCRPTDV